MYHTVPAKKNTRTQLICLPMLVQQARGQVLDYGTYVKKPARQEPVKAVCFPEASFYVVNTMAGDEAGISAGEKKRV